MTVNQPLLESTLARFPEPRCRLFPPIEDFAAGLGAGRNQVVWTRLAADLDTPVSLMLKLTEARKDCSSSRASPAARRGRDRRRG